jgi:hydroxymethylbilane synthase
MDRPLRIGTRGSPLALEQARMAAGALCAAHGWPDSAVELVPITTSGDRIQDRPLAEVGGKALWTKELDNYLLDGRTDVSVHSMKDVETIRPASLLIAAMLMRADPRDRLLGGDSLEILPPGTRVGTSSPRRRAQVLARRPEVAIVPLRGNIQTRLDKLGRGEADVILMAAAALERVGLGGNGAVIDGMLTAPGQGAIGLEVRADREDVRALVAAVDDPPTSRCVATERAFLAVLGGDCSSAVAALAEGIGGRILLRAEILDPDGREVHTGESEDPAALAKQLLGEASPGLRARFTG